MPVLKLMMTTSEFATYVRQGMNSLRFIVLLLTFIILFFIIVQICEYIGALFSYQQSLEYGSPTDVVVKRSKRRSRHSSLNKSRSRDRKKHSRRRDGSVKDSTVSNRSTKISLTSDEGSKTKHSNSESKRGSSKTGQKRRVSSGKTREKQTESDQSAVTKCGMSINKEIIYKNDRNTEDKRRSGKSTERKQISNKKTERKQITNKSTEIKRFKNESIGIKRADVTAATDCAQQDPENKSVELLKSSSFSTSLLSSKSSTTAEHLAKNFRGGKLESAVDSNVSKLPSAAKDSSLVVLPDLTPIPSTKIAKGSSAKINLKNDKMSTGEEKVLIDTLDSPNKEGEAYLL